MARRRKTHRPMAAINVVPFIDVMLVLLIIFMITAPLINQGVQVELPSADAQPLDPNMAEPVVVSVDASGRLYISVGEHPREPVTDEELTRHIAVIIASRLKAAFLIRADRRVPYEQVVRAMTLMQQGGAPSVGLSTAPLE